MTLFRTSFIALTFALSASGSCDEPTGVDAQEQKPGDIEEIVVYGEPNVVQLRYAMYRAEEAFFDVFNSLNTIKDFKVKCDYRVSLETRRRVHLCLPRFYLRNEAAVTRATMIENSFALELADQDAVKTTDRRKRQMVEELQRILSQHPELQEAYHEVVRTHGAYESRSKQRR